MHGVAVFPAHDMVVYNDGSKLKFLNAMLQQAAELPLEGPVTTVLTVGMWVFSAYSSLIPGVSAVPAGLIKACWMRPGAEPVQWTMTAPGLPFAHRDAVYALEAVFVSDETPPVLFSGSADGNIRMWQLNVASNVWECKVFEGHLRGVLGLVWLQGAQRLYSCSTDRTIKVWNPATGLCTGTVLPPAAPAAAAAPFGFGAAAAGGLRVGHAGGAGHSSEVMALADMTAGAESFLLSGALDGSIKLWRLTNPDDPQLVPEVQVAPDDRNAVLSMVCMELESMPGTPLLIVGQRGGSIKIRDIKNGLTVLATISDAHKADVRVVAQGPVDSFFSGGDDGRMCVWQCIVTA